MSANVTSITLPASTAVADGERLYIDIAQPATGGPYTLPTGTAGSPLTAGTGTTLVNSVPGGCPTIGTTVSSTAPSELFIALAYRAALTEYEILGCQTASPAATSVVEATLSASPSTYGASAVNTVIAGTVPVHAGHFTNLQIVTSLGGTCTTAPQFDVFDGTTNTGTALAATATTQTKGTATNQAETLTFAAGDNIGIYISTAGATCTSDQFTVTAQYAEP